MLYNKIITQGYGLNRQTVQSSGLVVLGIGTPLPNFIIETLEDQRPLRLRYGQSGTKRRLDQLDEVIIWAKLIEVNGEFPRSQIKGSVKVVFPKHRDPLKMTLEHVSTKIKNSWEDIKIRVRRLR